MRPRKNLAEPVETTGPADELLEATLPVATGHRDGDLAGFERRWRARPAAASANVWVASATGELAAVREFLAADPGLAVARGGTRDWEPLLYLCFSRLLRLDRERAARMREIARLLLDAGADPNCHWIDPQEGATSRETPLYGAAGIANDPELARLLIERGADPNDGETPYHMVEHDGVPCAELLVPRLAPLWRGCALGHKLDYDDLPGLQKLLELGSDPNGPTPFKMWPIHQAVLRNRPLSFFETLAAHGADLDKPNGFGRTAYAMAARSAKRGIMGWLERSGASTALEPVDAFLAACAAGDADGARRLLGAHTGLREGMTEHDRAEIHEAASIGNTAGVRTMLDLGWDANASGAIWGETRRIAPRSKTTSRRSRCSSRGAPTSRGAIAATTPRRSAGPTTGDGASWPRRFAPCRSGSTCGTRSSSTSRSGRWRSCPRPIRTPPWAVARRACCCVSPSRAGTWRWPARCSSAAPTRASGQGLTPLDVARERGDPEMIALLEARG